MTLLESVRQALRLVRAHPLRSGLTLFGLVWGTAAVIFLAAWGAGLREMNERAFQRAGKNMLMVWAGHVSKEFSPAVDRRYLWFTMDDVRAVRAHSRLAELVAGESRIYAPAAFRARALSFDTRGVEPDGEAIRAPQLAAGRFISHSDVDHRRRVLVIGARARTRLLGPEGGIGSVVRLDGKPFRVVGILARVGTQLSRDGDEIDDQVWVPITTHFMLWPNEFGIDDDMVRTVLVRLRDRRLLDPTEDEVRRILAGRLRVGSDDKEAVQTVSPVAMLRKLPLDQQNALNFLISATTILIGGIGVLSMMLDAVRERRQEIGVRLAVGARRRDVLRQFLLETAVIVSLGGLAGIALGVSGSLILGSESLRAGIPAELNDLIPVPELRLGTIAMAFSILAATGLLAAWIPARRAAAVDPAITLRAD